MLPNRLLTHFSFPAQFPLGLRWLAQKTFQRGPVSTRLVTAASILRLKIGDDWVLDQPEAGHDYGIDFTARYFEGGKTTRFECRIQLKGATRASTRSGHISQQIKTKHLNDWSHNQNLPVFLVVVDVSTEQCYFVWMQDYIQRTLKGVDWSRKATVTVRIPVESLIDDSHAFTKAVKAALDDTVSPHAAISNNRTLANRDPRQPRLSLRYRLR